MLAVPGALNAFLDVNDASTDGNERIFRDGQGQQVGVDTGRGDGAREGSLHPTVTSTSATSAATATRGSRCARPNSALDKTCPIASNIVLDGTPDHPKKDLNLDRCVHGPDPIACPTLEYEFPRVDFNGDGRLERLPAAVPIDASGNALPGAQTTPLTDLQVFQSRFSDPGKATAAQLDALMQSADVTVNTASLHQRPGRRQRQGADPARR